MPGLHHQDPVPRGKRIDECGLPGAGAGRRVDDNRCGGLENPLETFEHFQRESGEFGTAMVDCRPAHGTQDPVRSIRGPGDLKKMTSARKSHLLPSPRKTDVCRILCCMVPEISRFCNTIFLISQDHRRYGTGATPNGASSATRRFRPRQPGSPVRTGSLTDLPTGFPLPHGGARLTGGVEAVPVSHRDRDRPRLGVLPRRGVPPALLQEEPAAVQVLPA